MNRSWDDLTKWWPMIQVFLEISSTSWLMGVSVVHLPDWTWGHQGHILCSTRGSFSHTPWTPANWTGVLTFLPRDAMRKHGLCYRPVSACPSRWCIVSRRLNISSNFFLGLKILVFDPERWYPIRRGTPSAGCLKYQGEFCDFRLKSPSISEMVRERPIVAMER